jgi:hypothetical protein
MFAEMRKSNQFSVTVSSGYPLLHPDICPSPTATLVGLDLKFSWHSSSSSDNGLCGIFMNDTKIRMTQFLVVHPFSPRLLLPIQTTLSNILGKFSSRDLVGCVAVSNHRLHILYNTQTLPSDFRHLATCAPSFASDNETLIVSST